MTTFQEKTLENYALIHQLDHYMIGHKGFIAGGCFKNIFNKQSFKDIDIFFENEQDYQEAVQHFEGNENYVFSYENDKVKAFKDKYTNIRVELISYVYGTAQEIIAKFDFTVTKFAYFKVYKKSEDDEFDIEYRVTYHEDFFEHLQTKRLVIDDELVKPINSFERSYKYRDYGFRMCRESKVKILRAIMESDASQIDSGLSLSLYDGMD